MATLPTYFSDFLKEVRPTENQRNDLKQGHKTLRKRLKEDADLAPLIVSDFLQGSYRRSTVVRPKGDNRSDVDIIVVTCMNKDEYTPSKAMDAFVPFLEKHYKDKWRPQGRSFGIELSYVEMDLVITAAPSESVAGILGAKAVTADDSLAEAKDWRLVQGYIPLEERVTFSNDFLLQKALSDAASKPQWKTEPLWIPDREAEEWDETDPLAQIVWTQGKNGSCNGYYLGAVQAIKWWRRGFEDPKYPKGYPVEHLIGLCCPDDIKSVAEGVVLSLEKIVSDYYYNALLKTTPNLPDHGVPKHNVMGRVSGDDFAAFYDKVKEAAVIAREAYDETDTAKSAKCWRDLFGSKFPEPPSTPTKQGGFTPREQVSSPGGGRFA